MSTDYEYHLAHGRTCGAGVLSAAPCVLERGDSVLGIYVSVVWIVGVVISAVWAHKLGKSILAWTTLAVFLSPLVSLVLLAFMGAGSAIRDGADAGKAGFLQYRQDWRIALTRCPCCKGTGMNPESPAQKCLLCFGKRMVTGALSKSYADELERLMIAKHENPNL